MQVRLLLFAYYRDAAGTAELELQVPPGSTALEAVRRLRAHGFALAQIPAHPVVAINQVYASLDQVLNEGDELALLPPVAGG